MPIVANTYRRSRNFHVKKLSYDKFSCKNFFVGTTPYREISEFSTIVDCVGKSCS